MKMRIEECCDGGCLNEGLIQDLVTEYESKIDDIVYSNEQVVEELEDKIAILEKENEELRNKVHEFRVTMRDIYDYVHLIEETKGHEM